MGSPKALLPLQEETFLDRLIGLCGEYCAPVIVVLGHESERIRAALRRPAEFVLNVDYPLGQIISMQCGLRAVPSECPGVLFTLVDHPDPDPRTIRPTLLPRR